METKSKNWWSAMSLLRSERTLLMPCRNFGIVIAVCFMSSSALGQSCVNDVSMRDVEASASTRAANPRVSASITKLVHGIAKTYACKRAVNFYATPDTIVDGQSQYVGNEMVVHYTNKQRQGQRLCGTVVLVLPSAYSQSPTARAFRDKIFAAFFAFEQSIADQTTAIMQPLLPTGRNFPRSDAKYLARTGIEFQSSIATAFREVVAEQKLNEAQIEHFVNEVRCVSLPSVSGPDEAFLEEFAAALAVYKDAEPIIDTVLTP